MKRIRLLLLLTLLLLSACSNLASENVSFDQAAVGVMYTDALIEDSELVLFDQNGKQVGNKQFKEMGMFRIVPDGEGSWVLPVQFGKGWIRLNQDGQETKEGNEAFPIQVLSKEGVFLASFNSELDTNTLEVRSKQTAQTYKVDLAGFFRVLEVDESYIYIFADVIKEKRSVLYVLEKENGKLVKEIPLDTGEADDILVSSDRVILTSKSGNGRIPVVDKKNWQVNYITLPYSEPQFLFEDGKRILVTYAGLEGRISLLDRDSLKVIETKELSQPIFKARLADGKLYVLSQSQTRDLGGEIGIYSTQAWELEQKWELPVIRNTLVQDLEVVGRVD